MRLSKRAANLTVLQALTELCHQILDGWEVQTMWNLKKHCVMKMERHVLVLKNLYKWAKHGFAIVSSSQKDNVGPISWGCRIHWQVSWYSIKLSNGEAPVMLELWRMQSTPLLPLPSGPLWPGGLAPDRVLSVGQIELFDIC